MHKRVVLEELNTDLARAKSKVETWANRKVSKANDLRETQRRTVEEDRGQAFQMLPLISNAGRAINVLIKTSKLNGSTTLQRSFRA